MENFNFPMLNSHRQVCKYGPHLCSIELKRFVINQNFVWRNRKISRPPPFSSEVPTPKYTVWIKNFRLERGGLEILQLRQKTFCLILTVWGSIGQMGSFVIWFRCNLEHPTVLWWDEIMTEWSILWQRQHQRFQKMWFIKVFSNSPNPFSILKIKQNANGTKIEKKKI